MYKTVILLAILYFCESWCHPLRDENRIKGIWEQGAEDNIWT
jgi:hypothetical protein